MDILEHIELLESKIARVVEFIGRVSDENIRLKTQNKELHETITSLKEEKTMVEERFISAVGKFNTTVDAAIERTHSASQTASPPEQNPVPPPPAPPQAYQYEEKSKEELRAAPMAEPALPVQEAPRPELPSAYTVDEDEAENETEDETETDDYLTEDDTQETEELEESGESEEAELDIF